MLNNILNGAYKTPLGKKMWLKAMSINQQLTSKSYPKAHFMPLWAFNKLLDEVGLTKQGNMVIVTITDPHTMKESVHIACTKGA